MIRQGKSMKVSGACASFHVTIFMTSHIATLMPTATTLLITRERVDFMPALVVGRLSLAYRCKSKNAVLLINGIKKRHSELSAVPEIAAGDGLGVSIQFLTKVLLIVIIPNSSKIRAV
jgi:hypothetical protein